MLPAVRRLGDVGRSQPGDGSTAPAAGQPGTGTQAPLVPPPEDGCSWLGVLRNPPATLLPLPPPRFLSRSRIACYVTIFQNISNLRDIFYKEMSKVRPPEFLPPRRRCAARRLL